MSTPELTSLAGAAGAGSAAYRQPLPADPDASADDRLRAQRWTAALSQRLFERAKDIERHRAYFAGTQPLRFATDTWEETFGETFGACRNNWMPLVVNSAVERMEVQGVRLDPTDTDPDDYAWEIWQDNRLDLYSSTLHTDLGVTGWGYTLTWPDEHGNPRITVEDPAQTIVMRDPGDRRRILAGLKRWRDLVGEWHARLFTPDVVWTLKGGTSATPVEEWEIASSIPNPLRRVPLVEFVSNPDIEGNGRSDLAVVEPLQDALDKISMDMMVASEYTAYRQRVLINAEVPTADDGTPLTRAELGITRFFTLEENASIQELSASDLSNYTTVASAIKADIAALSHTPPQYILGAMVNVSGDALKAAESGLFSRVRAKLQWCGEAWEETIRLAFLVLGLEDFAVSAEVVWKNPEITSEATRVDALTKLATINVPDEALWELYGATSTTRTRWRIMREQQAQLQGMELGIVPGSGGAIEPDDGSGATADEAELALAA